MKKVLSIVLAIAMIASMATVAFAAAGEKTVTLANDNKAVIDVNGAYESGTKIDNYKVDIKWLDLSFTYTSSSEVWDVENHVYVAAVDGTWAPKTIGDAITVTNHSSQAITSTAGAAVEEDIDVTLTIDTEEKTVAAPAEKATEGVSVKYDLTVDGKLAQDFTGKIGTVTITIGGIPAEYNPVAVPAI